MQKLLSCTHLAFADAETIIWSGASFSEKSYRQKSETVMILQEAIYFSSYSTIKKIIFTLGTLGALFYTCSPLPFNELLNDQLPTSPAL